MFDDVNSSHSFWNRPCSSMFSLSKGATTHRFLANGTGFCLATRPRTLFRRRYYDNTFPTNRTYWGLMILACSNSRRSLRGFWSELYLVLYVSRMMCHVVMQPFEDMGMGLLVMMTIHHLISALAGCGGSKE